MSLYESPNPLVSKKLMGKSLILNCIHYPLISFRLQYSCLENPMDRGAWQAAVHGVATSQTRLGDFTFTFHFHALEEEMATHSSVLAWRIPGTGSLVGCRLWGRTELDTTEATWQQQSNNQNDQICRPKQFGEMIQEWLSYKGHRFTYSPCFYTFVQWDQDAQELKREKFIQLERSARCEPHFRIRNSSYIKGEKGKLYTLSICGVCVCVYMHTFKTLASSNCLKKL